MTAGSRAGSAKHHSRVVGSKEQSLWVLHPVTCRAHPEHCTNTAQGIPATEMKPLGKEETNKCCPEVQGQEPILAVGGMRTQRVQAYITRSGQTAAPRSRGQPSPVTPEVLDTEQAAAQSQCVSAALREHTHCSQLPRAGVPSRERAIRFSQGQ